MNLLKSTGTFGFFTLLSRILGYLRDILIAIFLGTGVLADAFFIAFILQMLTIHQFGALGMIGGDIEAAQPSYRAFMADYGTTFRTFGHGALHGFMTGVFLALPLIATNSLYERRSWKYSLVTGGFWIVCFMLMGGIICAWK